jgi:hypothetical protein
MNETVANTDSDSDFDFDSMNMYDLVCWIRPRIRVKDRLLTEDEIKNLNRALQSYKDKGGDMRYFDGASSSVKKPPNCCQIWWFGCCRPSVREQTAECCFAFSTWLGIGILVLSIATFGIFLMPWILGNAVYGGNANVYVPNQFVQIPCWTMPTNGDTIDCMVSFWIGFAVWIMILLFIGIVVFGILRIKSETPDPDDTWKFLFWLCVIFFWIGFPPFIGAIGGFRLAMNHYPNCQYWKNDMVNNIEYGCRTTDSILSSAFETGFCSYDKYTCCPPKSGTCWPCSDQENLDKSRWECSRELKKQCSWCKGVGWATVALPVWFLPLAILLLWYIGWLFYEIVVFVYKKYQTWKEELTVNIPSSTDNNLESQFNNLESQFNNSTDINLNKINMKL